MKKIYSAPQSAIEKKVLRASILAGSGPTIGGESTGVPVGSGQAPEGEDAGSRTRSTLID